jgi:MFS transporter, ACS family, glucarate transporter
MAVVFGKIVDVTHSFTTPLVILSAVLFAGCLLWFFVNAERTIVLTTK